MAEVVLLDAGHARGADGAPGDTSCLWAKAAFARLRLPWPTCQAVITETCCLLNVPWLILANSLCHRCIREQPSVELEHFSHLPNLCKSGSKIEPSCGLICGQHM